MARIKLSRYELENLAARRGYPICSDCGAKMTVKKATDSVVFGRFDTEGNRQCLLLFGCPNQKWYQRSWSHCAIVRLTLLDRVAGVK